MAGSYAGYKHDLLAKASFITCSCYLVAITFIERMTIISNLFSSALKAGGLYSTWKGRVHQASIVSPCISVQQANSRQIACSNVPVIN